MTGSGIGTGLISFTDVNRPSNSAFSTRLQPTREISQEAGQGLIKRWRDKLREDRPEAASLMAGVLDDLKGDVSQKALDQYFLENNEKLQQIGASLGLEGEITSLTMQGNGSFLVGAASGATESFALLDTYV